MTDYKSELKKLFLNEKGNNINFELKNKEGIEVKWVHGYPAEYQESMPCIGFQSIYFLINKHKNVLCERFFLPPKKYGSVLSLETQTRLKDFDVISFTLHYEPLYMNMLSILEQSNLPVFSNKRKEKHPLIIGGGICPSYNPEPLAYFFDVLVIGEGEGVIDKIVKVIKESKKKKEDKKTILKKLSKIQGVYVPSLYKFKFKKDSTIKKIVTNIPHKFVKRNVSGDLNKNITSFIVNKRLPYRLEILRGCAYNCKFCVLKRFFNPPRIRSYDTIIDIAKKARKFTDKIRLIAPSEVNHPDILRIYKKLNDLGFKLIIRSQRADKITEEFLEFFKKNKQKTLIIAPEACSQNLREKIGKNINDKSIFKVVDYVNKFNIPTLQLFLITGFPEETEKDLRAIVDMSKRIIKKLKKNKRLVLCINCHIKKPFTDYEIRKQTSIETYYNIIKKIKKKLKIFKNIEVRCMEKNNLIVESILVRGDRRSGLILYEAFKKGGTYKSWVDACEKSNLNLEFHLRERKNEILPWSVISWQK